MTISNALPVQFWINGVETFNEKNICGVEPVCFCQPFNCDDEIRIQFQDITDKPYNLQVLDSNSNELNLISIPEVSSGVYQIELIPENYGICDETIQLKIITSSIPILSSWTNETVGDDWNLGVNPSLTLSTAFDFSKSLTIPYVVVSGETYDFIYDLDITTSNIANLSSLSLVILDGGFSQVASYLIADELSSSGNRTGTITVTGNTGVYIGLRFGVNNLLNNVTVDINSFYIYDTVAAKSDCLDIKTDHDCTVLLEYTNSEDFNNIVYLTSPTSEYKLRIPAQFWKEDNPMEQEDSELSNGVIKTRRQTITQKRYLEIGYLPNYMHLKTQLALMHDSLTIEGDQWKKRDAYESESIKRYPLKRANVWLTLYNSIDDNIL